MTAMGILGTFLGLAIGLTNFDFSSSKSLGESIQVFISGINIAFYTSIYGIVISIYMNSFYNSVEERFEEKLMKLEKCFDKLGMNQSEQSMWARLYEEERTQTPVAGSAEQRICRKSGGCTGGNGCQNHLMRLIQIFRI